jgi:hypothetical protein
MLGWQTWCATTNSKCITTLHITGTSNDILTQCCNLQIFRSKPRRIKQCSIQQWSKNSFWEGSYVIKTPPPSAGKHINALQDTHGHVTLGIGFWMQLTKPLMKFISKLLRYSVSINTLPATSVMRARWEAVRQSFPSVMLFPKSLHSADPHPLFFFNLYSVETGRYSAWNIGKLHCIEQTS